MLELLVVISMGLVIAAYAVPNVLMGVANMRLRSAASNVAGLIQDERIRAVKGNARADLATSIVDSVTIVCVDENTNGSCGSTEKKVQLPNTITRLTDAPSGDGAPSETVDDTAGLSSPQVASLPSFNARGIPCYFNAGSCTTNTGFVTYLSGAEPFGATTAYAAVTVTPSGRVKVWTWSGSAWSN